MPTLDLNQGESGIRPAELQEYEPPQVLSYRGEVILELLGPAQACSFTNAIIVCPPPGDDGIPDPPWNLSTPTAEPEEIPVIPENPGDDS